MRSDGHITKYLNISPFLSYTCLLVLLLFRISATLLLAPNIILMFVVLLRLVSLFVSLSRRSSLANFNFSYFMYLLCCNFLVLWRIPSRKRFMMGIGSGNKENFCLWLLILRLNWDTFCWLLEGVFRGLWNFLNFVSIVGRNFYDFICQQ